MRGDHGYVVHRRMSLRNRKGGDTVFSAAATDPDLFIDWRVYRVFYA